MEEGFSVEPEFIAMLEAREEEVELVADEPPVERSRKKKAKTKSKAKARQRSQYFVFTLNMELTEEESLPLIEKFKANVARMEVDKAIGYLHVGHEVGEEEGRHHLQGYFETVKGVKWSYDTFKGCTLFEGLKSPYVKAARGSGEQNKVYTGKAVDEGRYFVEIGSYRNYGQGRSADMQVVKGLLDEGKSLKEIYQRHFETSASHYRFFKEYRTHTREARSWPTQVVYVYGPSGSGKSRMASELYPPNESNYWLSLPKSNNVWWDGYDHHDVVVIDDWYPGFFGTGHVSFMLRLVDRYALQVPVHGGQVQLVCKKIVFTSNYAPSEMDDEKFSGFPWNETNPLFNRVYLREPKWELCFVGPRGDELRYRKKAPIVVSLRRGAHVEAMAAAVREKSRLSNRVEEEEFSE